MASRNSESSGPLEDLSGYARSRGTDANGGNWQRKFRFAGAALGILALVLGGMLLALSSGLLSPVTATGITPDPAGLARTGREKNGRTIVLFLLPGQDDSLTAAPDAIMLLTIDPGRGKVKISSILRDSRVRIEGDTRNGEHLRWEAKLATAYEEGGAALALSTTNENYGLELTDYVALNEEMAQGLFNLFGGLELALSEEEILALDVTALPAEDGRFHSPLDALQLTALGKLGGRGEEDLRAMRQQRILAGLLGKMKTMEQEELVGLLREPVSRWESSMDAEELFSVLSFFTGDFTAESIVVPEAQHEETLIAGPGEDGLYYLKYDTAEAGRRISSFILEENSPFWGSWGNTGKNAMRDGE